MRLATRTGLAAFAAASVSLLLIIGVFNRTLPQVLQDRVDDQLNERAATAPILVAVADRLARSELNGTVEGARVSSEGQLVELGLLPTDPLPPVGEAGFETVSADGQRWRLLTIDVSDVPRPGDEATVQLAAPLGDVDTRTRELRRRLLSIGLAAAAFAGLVGYLLGRRATRPLSSLRVDAGALDDGDASTWSVGSAYGSPEVDEVAGALNTSLARVADESERRTSALEAARSFASSATHELRTPLQSALTNLDIARSPLADDTVRGESVELAHEQLLRMGAGLAAVRALADAEFADLSWFAPADLGEVVEVAVTDEARRESIDVAVRITAGHLVPIWRDGVRLAVANVVRNALDHGRSDDGSASVTVSVAGVTVTVDDHGPGIATADRDRVLHRFERGGSSGGSGLGLAVADQVARAHGGGVEIGDAPGGGARIVLRFGR